MKIFRQKRYHIKRPFLKPDLKVKRNKGNFWRSDEDAFPIYITIHFSLFVLFIDLFFTILSLRNK